MDYREDVWQNPRKRKTDSFTPIDQVSEEDLHPDYRTSRGLLNPEEALIAAEDREFMKDISDEDWAAWVENMLTDDPPEDSTIEYPWEKNEDEYWQRLELLGRAYETREERHEDLQELMDRFRMPQGTSKQEIERLISKHSKTGRSYGIRGRENRNKHLRGTDTIRREAA